MDAEAAALQLLQCVKILKASLSKRHFHLKKKKYQQFFIYVRVRACVCVCVFYFLSTTARCRGCLLSRLSAPDGKLNPLPVGSISPACLFPVSQQECEE